MADQNIYLILISNLTQQALRYKNLTTYVHDRQTHR